jgi:hypothetical protein
MMLRPPAGNAGRRRRHRVAMPLRISLIVRFATPLALHVC